ncbi:MAG TPA: RNA-binding S4 domain-containing protein [Burkholderiaceae bacterium]|nr:RNA-binding S4 domain-containing protein [Burkholderiaceae bacterium]
MSEPARIRLDKWLWAARLYKTRALAAEAVDRGWVSVNDAPAKPGRELRLGDRIGIKTAGLPWRRLDVTGLSALRGPAVVAQTLYAETDESKAARATALEQRRLAPEPASSLPHGRPTKADRRDIERAQERWRRWSASVDDEPGSR